MSAEAAIPALLLGATLTIFSVVTFTRPNLGAAAFLITFFVASMAPSMQLVSFIVLSCFFLGVVGAKNRKLLSLFSLVVLLIGGLFDSDKGEINTDLAGFIVWLTLLGLCLILGWFIGNRKKNHLDSLKRQEDALREQRSHMAMSLHDSVVSHLTSVVMKSEATAAKQLDNLQIKDDLEVIAESGRYALLQMRELIDVLRGGEGSRLMPEENDRVYSKYFEDKLIQHGFHLVGEAPAWTKAPLLNRPDWANLLRMFLTETTTNILKYAVKNSDVRVVCLYRQGKLQNISVYNEIQPNLEKHRPIEMSTGLGLPALEERACILGARIEGESKNGVWRTTISLPET